MDWLRPCYNFCILFADHGEKLHDVPDEYLVDTLSIAKKIAVAQGTENYNILQVWSYHPCLSSSPRLPLSFKT